jgi:hypothetical protein
VAEDPVFRKDDKYSLSRPEALKRALEKTKQVYKRVHELGLDGELICEKLHLGDPQV